MFVWEHRQTAAVAICAVALAVGAAACGSSGTAAGSSGGLLGGAGHTGAAPVGVPSGQASTPSLPGVPVKTLTCDDFPTDTMQAAVRQVVPTVAVTADADADSAAAQSGEGLLKCSYVLATPGTDTSSADRGEVRVLLTLGDTWRNEGAWPDGVAFDYPLQLRDFAKDQADTKASGTGQQVDDGKPLYREVPEKLGEGAYIIDWPHFQSDGTQSNYTIDVKALHSPRPCGFEIDLGYTMAQLDPNQPDKSLDAAVRDDGKRVQLITGIGEALLAKIPTSPRK